VGIGRGFKNVPSHWLQRRRHSSGSQSYLRLGCIAQSRSRRGVDGREHGRRSGQRETVEMMKKSTVLKT